MTPERHEGHLGAVYDAKTPEEVAAHYDGWAETYDAEMARAGYRHPAIGMALLTRYVARGAGPVLDAGCGTGLLGEWLSLLGYASVEGLDISEGMLSVAARRGNYERLHRLVLGSPLPFADNQFAAVISVGVFTTGHVGAEALPELARIIRPGGALVLTVKVSLWANGLEAALGKLAGFAIADRTDSYISMPGEPATSPSIAVAAVRD